MGNDSSASVAYQNMVILHVQFLIKFKLTDSVDFLEKKKKRKANIVVAGQRAYSQVAQKLQ